MVRTRRSAILVALLSLALLATGLWLLPPVLTQPETEAPARIGTLETDEIGDECIENLDILLIHYQETGELDEDFTCPASDTPYMLELEDELLLRVYCPTPEEHKVTALYVGAQDTIPTVIEGGEEQ